MKRSALLILAGGLLAAVAFFLPYFLPHPQNGLFGPGASLLQGLEQASRSQNGSTPLPGITGVGPVLFEPAAALLLIAGGLLASKIGRAAHVWGLGGAVFSLAFLLWYFTSLYALAHLVDPRSGAGDLVQYLGSGYWLAVIGALLGLAGALLGWREPSTLAASLAQSEGRPSRRRARCFWPGVLVVLLGGLVMTASVFIPSFLPAMPRSSLLDLMKQSDLAPLLWPIPLAALLVLASGLFALTGRQAAYLGSLSGSLVGLPLVLVLWFEQLAVGGASPLETLGTAYWVTAIGCFLGFIGALLGLLARPGAPVPPTPVLTPAPS